ncbi:hypothetical protein M569_16667 [Genlisea aurea]|uniref:Transmembrane protein n=1 Tax=Genlisea aurea TaxID=192259 RepID=S8BU68_9LAMI|nr:hypothetical protein M569_16667 [Genlisea aurea]
MREISGRRRFRAGVLCNSILLLIVSVYADHSSNPSNGTRSESHSARKGSTIALICFLLLVVAVLSFFLYKIWEKKKREEQYARLLKLFEEDDQLEVELGLRD